MEMEYVSTQIRRVLGFCAQCDVSVDSNPCAGYGRPASHFSHAVYTEKSENKDLTMVGGSYESYYSQTLGMTNWAMWVLEEA